MPVLGLEQFARESYAARDEVIELTRRGFGSVVAFAYREVITLSPVADPDQPGAGRLRASWTAARGAPNEVFAQLPSVGSQLAPPDEAAIQAVAASVQLGDEVWITNGSPCVSTVNDRTSFVDQAITATESKAEEIAQQLSNRDVSGLGAIARQAAE
jgi:hypothetical protein